MVPLLLCLALNLVGKPSMPSHRDLASLVDVNVPTIHEGLPFRGASVPFGMMMFGPNGTDTAEGYNLFTLQGAEVNSSFFGYVPFRPTTQPLVQVKDAEPVPNRNSKGAPGYFHDFQSDGIEVELTATERTGFARFTFPKGCDQRLRYGASESTQDPSKHLLTGFHDKGAGYKLFFAAEFDRPFVEATAGALGFGKDHRALLLKVGMSYVSIANAEANLNVENPSWDFEKVRRNAAKAWEKALSRIEVSGGRDADRALFATCLYRTHLQPNLFSDTNGDYLGFDGAVHQAGRHPQYASYSVWDIYRTWVQLMAVLETDRVSDMMQTLVRASQEGGGAMPRWATANRETGIMEEGSATPLVAGAYAFGARGFDLEEAWRAMDRVESQPGVKCQDTEAHPSLDLFLKHGYMPQGLDYNRQRAASFTLEYGMAAFTLSEYAKALGKTVAAERYLRQSQAWKNSFNPFNGYLQSKNPNGTWYPTNFDPAKGHFIGFTEGNSAQYTWTVRHNMAGVVEKVGGRVAAKKRLDEFFRDLNAGPNSAHCWIGNEPCFTTPWAYHWCGAPERTQEVVDRILNEVWQPGAIPGADDLGALSSWYVWASTGLFPAIPGTDVLLLTAPRFKTITIHLPKGQKLTISTHGEGRYVKSVAWNGEAISANWLRWSKLTKGGTLSFELAKTPSPLWGTQPADEPPSFDAASPGAIVP